MNNFNQNSGSNKKQKTNHNEYINVPIHLLPLVSTNNKKIVIPDPLPQSVSLLRPPNYSVRKYLSNMAILRVYEIINLLSSFLKQAIHIRNITNDEQQFFKNIEPCISIIDKMFAPYGSIHYTISPNHANSKIRTFELSVLSFLYFLKERMCHMAKAELELLISNVKAQVLNNGTIYVESNDFTIIKTYQDGSKTIKKFNVKIIFDSWLKIEFFELVRLSCENFASQESLSSKNLNEHDEMDDLLDFILKRRQQQENAKKEEFKTHSESNTVIMDRKNDLLKTNGIKRGIDEMEPLDFDLEKKHANSDYSTPTAVSNTSDYTNKPTYASKYPFPNYKHDFENSASNLTHANTPPKMTQIKQEHVDHINFTDNEQSAFMKNHAYNTLADDSNSLSDAELMSRFLRSKVDSFNIDPDFGAPAGFLKMLQLSDVMSNLKNLMLYQKINGIQSPNDAMFNFVDDLRKREKELIDK